MKDLTRLRSGGVNHGILLAFTFLAFVNCVFCEKFTQYVNQGADADLKCDLNISSLDSAYNVVWSFKELGSDETKSISCNNNKDEDYTCSTNATSKNSSNELISLLVIKKVSKRDYGVYSCGSASSDTILLKQIPKPSIRRRDDNDKDWVTSKTSLRIEKGSNARLACFVEGFGEDQEIAWRFINETRLNEAKDQDQDVLKLLKLHDEIKVRETEFFEDFTVSRVYDDSNTSLIYEELEGPATFDIRGSYVCEVRLRNEYRSHSQNFPADLMSSSLFVRVVEGKEWVLPGIILFGEIVLVSLFTLIITLKERKEGEVVGDYADSEDEDDPKKEN